jgi:hypothetical protein
MRLDLLSVTLRQRSPWEAMDLGIALVRRHARAVWRPWFALTLPFFLLANAIGWLAGKVWLAALLMWWLKPLFDRVPLYVLSRAVFGTMPSVRQTLRAPELWSLGPLFAWLTWRRFHPSRSLLLPVDMLEGLRGANRGARVKVLQRAISSQALGLIFACANFEAILAASVWMLVLMFMPFEWLSESARAVWETFFQNPPAWAQLIANLVAWLSMCLVEPFYVGAGFGLYLNRRTQLEAWDVELVFRRLAERAAQALPSAASLLLVVLLLGASLAPAPSLAAAAKAENKPTPLTPREFVGAAWRDHDRRFGDAVARAMKDPLLAPKQTVTRWERRFPEEEQKTQAQPAWVRMLAGVFGFIAEYGLWLAAGALLGFVLWRLPKWLPWVRRQIGATAEASEILEEDVQSIEALPDDVARVVLELWQTEHRREALALLYRASVERVAERLGTPFPPGATEAECLRRARKLDGDALQAEFALVVRTWQRAAYAWRFPEPAEFDALMRGWSSSFEAPP